VQAAEKIIPHIRKLAARTTRTYRVESKNLPNLPLAITLSIPAFDVVRELPLPAAQLSCRAQEYQFETALTTSALKSESRGKKIRMNNFFGWTKSNTRFLQLLRHDSSDPLQAKCLQCCDSYA